MEDGRVFCVGNSFASMRVINVKFKFNNVGRGRKTTRNRKITKRTLKERNHEIDKKLDYVIKSQ